MLLGHKHLTRFILKLSHAILRGSLPSLATVELSGIREKGRANPILPSRSRLFSETFCDSASWVQHFAILLRNTRPKKSPPAIVPQAGRWYNELNQSFGIDSFTSTGGIMSQKHYTPPLSRFLVCALYHEAKARGIPMTQLANNLVETALKDSSGCLLYTSPSPRD